MCASPRRNGGSSETFRIVGTERCHVGPDRHDGLAGRDGARRRLGRHVSLPNPVGCRSAPVVDERPQVRARQPSPLDLGIQPPEVLDHLGQALPWRG